MNNETEKVQQMEKLNEKLKAVLILELTVNKNYYCGLFFFTDRIY